MAGWLLQFSRSKFPLSVKSRQFYTKIKRKYRKNSHRHLLEKLACSWLGNGTEIFDQIIFCHTNASISNMKDVVLLISFDLNWQFLCGCKGWLVRKWQKSDLVQCIRRIGNKFSQENLKEKKIISTSDYYQVSFYFWSKIMLRTNWHHLMVVPKLMKINNQEVYNKFSCNSVQYNSMNKACISTLQDFEKCTFKDQAECKSGA